MLSDHVATHRHQGSGCQGRRVGAEVTLEHAHVVVVGNEADLHRFRLLGGDEPEAPRGVSCLLLGERPDGRQHPRDDGAIDAPEEVRLVLLDVASPEQRAVAGDRIVTGRDVSAVERVRMIEKVPELGERIAADAGDGGAAARVFGHEVRDHVAAEPVFQVQDVVRNAELVGDQSRVGDRVQGAARTVGYVVAIAEQLHGSPDDVVAGVHEEGGRDGGVDAAGHGDENAVGHRCSTADSARTFSTIFGMAPMTASTSSSLLSFPNEKRSAATPSSRGTPMAVRTCEGSTAPVEHADPDEQAIPARSKCIKRASLSVPGIDTFETCGARGPRAALTTASGTTASSRRSSSSRSAATRVAKPACSWAASSTAFPSAAIPGTFSVPGRIPNCCPPPWMMASTTWRSRTMSAPIPFGAPILWPEMVRSVQGTSRSETGIFPKAWTASTWNGTPASRHRSASRATGCTAPTSLFTHITATTATPPPPLRASASSNASSETAPSPSTGRMTSSPPRWTTACAAASTALCSMADTATRNGPPRSRAASAAPITARLSASVPPDVKITCPGSTPPPKTSAIVRFASSTPARAVRPKRCAEDGFPKASRPR